MGNKIQGSGRSAGKTGRAEIGPKNTGQPLRAAIYSRTSDGKRDEKYSPQAQVEICQASCEARGWKVKYIIIEDDTRVDLEIRPKFRLLMERAPLGQFDVLVSWKLDRWARSLHDTLRIERYLAQHGVSLHSATEPFDTTTPFGRFCFNSLASVAQLERDLNSERVRMAIHAKAKQHRWPTQKPPLGYSKDADGFLAPNAAEVELVSLVWNLYEETRSAPETLFRLNEQGVKFREGLRLTTTEIYRILDNELYVGRYMAAGVDDHVEDYRIMSDERFFRMRMLRRRSVIRKPRMRRARRLASIEKVFNQWMENSRNPTNDLYPDPNEELAWGDGH
jgi:site-specific DNA recombinase